MIAIKGLRQGVLIVFNNTEDSPWVSQLFELERKLDANPRFFKGARVALDVKNYLLHIDDITRVKAVLHEREVELWAVLSENTGTTDNVRALGLADTIVEPEPAKRKLPKGFEPPPPPPKAETDSGAPVLDGQAAGAPAATPTQSDAAEQEAAVEGTDGLLVRRRVRSGQVLRHPGHIVVIGDVNPGAQLIAGGDIIVWGRLQGSAHAGALGDRAASVCALDLSAANLIKIADATRVARADRKPRNPKPESAIIRDGAISLVEWSGKS